jgi:hypothetical protein
MGGRVAEVARLLGTPLMPWQALVADVALEVDPESGLLAYREVILTVPRQSGKTTLLLAVMVHRALGFGSRQRVLYTAQTRNDARKKWEDEHVAVLQQSPLRGMFRVRRSNGAEAIRWRNGSMHGVTSSTEKAGHGETLDLGVMDEAFGHEDDRLEQALKPTMVTRPQPQLWIVSTAGTIKSTYLREKVESGRLAATAGITSGVAYFEWSAQPDADPADPATWWDCMPALGRTVRPDAIAADFQTMKLDEFRRAYLNVWASEAPDEWQVISQAAWQAIADPAAPPAREQVAFCADVNYERTHAAIGVAARRPDGLTQVEVAEHRPGTAWVVPRLVELAERYRPCAVVMAPSAPGGSLIPEAEAAGLDLVKPGVPEIAGACGAFYDAAGANPLVTDPPSIRHLNQPELNVALAGALRRDVGDRWLWARKGVQVDISPLVAVTLAAYGLAVKGQERVALPAIY